MQLKYVLTENLLTTLCLDNNSARTHGSESHDKKKFIKCLLAKGVLITETNALAVLNILENTMCEISPEDIIINLPLFNTLFPISDVFEGSS